MSKTRVKTKTTLKKKPVKANIPNDSGLLTEKIIITQKNKGNK